MTDRELLQMALDALEWCYDVTEWPANGKTPQDKAIEALRARLARPKQPNAPQEPVAWWDDRGDFVDLNVSGHGTPLYTAPPKREWHGLTDEEIAELWVGTEQRLLMKDFARAIEAKLKEKNHG